LPRVCFYISGHGFGHAARAVTVMNAVVRRNPRVDLVVRTRVPQSFLDQSLATRVERLEGEVDTGVVQPDSLSVDEETTARRAAAFYADFDAKVDEERALLHRLRAGLVVGDIPPLAFAAAHAADIPSVALGNFTWDWIYEGYPCFDAVAPGVRALVAGANAEAALALRLPFAGGFASMPRVEDMPLVARCAARSRDETRQLLQLEGSRPVALATFGGHGGGIPLANAAASGAFTIVGTEYEVAHGTHPPGLRLIPTAELRRAGVTYTDLLAACDVVVTKLGYGIVSECVANQVPLLYTTRGRFREQEVFEREMPQVLRSGKIDRDDLLTGNWASAIDRLLASPPPPARMPVNGADACAQAILALLDEPR
jgi:L-arabinokinase